MSDGPTLPGWHVRAFDYIGLGFLLLVADLLWQHPKVWYSWCGALAVGLICLWFGETAPTAWKRLKEKWQAPKALAAARAESARISAENEDLRKKIAELGKPVIELPVSKLTIHSATYGALLPGAKQYDVTNCLRQMIQGDGLVLQIQNGNFWAAGLNYVQQDPREGEKKWLKVDYSFDGGDVIHASRREDYRLVLPEDTYIKEKLENSQEEMRHGKLSYQSDIRKCEEAWRKCEGEKRTALAQVEEMNAKSRFSGLLSSLQIEALTLAKELRDFLESLPSYPRDPQQHLGETDYDYITRTHSSEGLQAQLAATHEKQGQWRLKLMHGYANRKFGERITALMHRAGEEVEYPAFVANYAEKPPFGADDVRRLAQQMEMMAIWINRKERNEVDLLRPKQ